MPAKISPRQVKSELNRHPQRSKNGPHYVMSRQSATRTPKMSRMKSFQTSKYKRRHIAIGKQEKLLTKRSRTNKSKKYSSGKLPSGAGKKHSNDKTKN